eukprot:212992-Amphidinium_carterae.1
MDALSWPLIIHCRMSMTGRSLASSCLPSEMSRNNSRRLHGDQPDAPLHQYEPITLTLRLVVRGLHEDLRGGESAEEKAEGWTGSAEEGCLKVFAQLPGSGGPCGRGRRSPPPTPSSSRAKLLTRPPERRGTP